MFYYIFTTCSTLGVVLKSGTIYLSFFFQSFLICHLYVSCKHTHVHMHNVNLNMGMGMEIYIFIYISLSLCALIDFKLWLQC